jgi:hypothetical protein
LSVRECCHGHGSPTRAQFAAFSHLVPSPVPRCRSRCLCDTRPRVTACSTSVRATIPWHHPPKTTTRRHRQVLLSQGGIVSLREVPTIHKSSFLRSTLASTLPFSSDSLAS